MNQRNVEALLMLLAHPDAPTEGDWRYSRAELQARFLASRGVLVPSALTWVEAERIGRAWVDAPDDEEFAATVQTIGRIAKGEG